MSVVLPILIIDLLIPFVIAIPYKGYSHTKTVMSVLGCKNSPWGRAYNIWMVISGSGISYLGYIIFCHYKYAYHSLSIVLFVLIVLYGIGDEVISGLFPINESKEDVNLSTKIHGVGSVFGFLAMQFAPLVLGIIQIKENQLALAISSIIFFVLAFVSFVLFIMGEKPKFEKTVLGLTGLWQRVICALLYVPFVIWLISILIK